MDIYNSHGVVVKPKDAVSATTIPGITNQSISLNSEHNATPTAGATRAQHSEITSITPRGTFTTFDVATLLELIGTEGACLEGGAAEGFALYQMKLEACGDVATGAVHRKILIPNGRIIPTSLSVGHRSNAELTAEVISIYDGTNLPVIPTDSVAAPSDLADLFRFTLGDITLGGVAIEGNTNVDINFGIDLQTDGGDSDQYDTHLQLVHVKPEITITTRDVSKFKTSGGISLVGLHGTHANSSIILRRRINGTGDYSTDADSIKITLDGLVSVDSAHSSQGNNRAEMTIKITALDDQTNDPLVIDYAHDLSP